MSMNGQTGSQHHFSDDGRFKIIEYPEGRVIIDTKSYSYIHADELLAPIMRGAMAHALAKMTLSEQADENNCGQSGRKHTTNAQTKK